MSCRMPHEIMRGLATRPCYLSALPVRRVSGFLRFPLERAPFVSKGPRPWGSGLPRAANGARAPGRGGLVCRETVERAPFNIIPHSATAARGTPSSQARGVLGYWRLWLWLPVARVGFQWAPGPLESSCCSFWLLRINEHP